MISRSFAAFILSAIILVPSSAFAGRYTTPEEDIKKNEMYATQRMQRISPALPPLLGPHASRLRSTISRVSCNGSGHLERNGQFTCSEYTSGEDGSRWKFAIRRDEQRRNIVNVFRLRNNTWITHATLHGDIVTSSSAEARMYAQGQYNKAQDHTANDQSPMDRAVNELDRTLGTALPGKGQPPLRLPPIFGR